MMSTNSSIYWMTSEIRELNIHNGWRTEEGNDNTLGDDVALLHSEVSEILEAFRHDNWEELQAECADVLIRLLDFCDRRNIDLFTEYMKKMRKNWERGYRHGGKKL